MSLENRNLILKRDGSLLQLPATEYITVDAPPHVPNEKYMMFRVEKFTEETGVLELKHESGKWNEKSFAISLEVNSADLIAANIKRIVFAKSKTHNYFAGKNFNSDINLDERLSATATVEKKNESVAFQTEQRNSQPLRQPIRRTISLPIKEIKLEDGKASFRYFIESIQKEALFEVYNSNIKKEYDAVKNYFAKALQLKRFSIDVQIELLGLELVSSSATSAHIDLINETLLEKVTDYYVQEEILFSSDEVSILKDKLETIAAISKDEENKDVDWLLRKIAEKEQTKHYIHLRYLSSKHSPEAYNLLITGRPLSFIFLIESGRGFFLVWETYNTEEATYLWKLEANNVVYAQAETEKLIDKIKWLRRGNKLNYIHSKPKGFKRIEHEYSGEDFGFKKWKLELIEAMNVIE